MPHKYTRWTEEEIAILRKNYSSMGQKVSELIPNHSPACIVQKANILGLFSSCRWSNKKSKSSEQVKPWSLEEDALIKELFPRYGAACAASFPARTETAVVVRARRLGVGVFSKSRPWSEVELTILNANFPTIGHNVALFLYNRSMSECMRKAKELRLKHQVTRSSWSKEEDELLTQEYPQYGPDAFINFPNRSLAACRNRIVSLGLGKSNTA